MWFATTPPHLRPQGEEVDDYVTKYWQEPFGDRRQELVFIGIDMPKEAMLNQLHDALLSDGEMAIGEMGWAIFPDPFPQFHVPAQ